MNLKRHKGKEGDQYEVIAISMTRKMIIFFIRKVKVEMKINGLGFSICFGGRILIDSF